MVDSPRRDNTPCVHLFADYSNSQRAWRQCVRCGEEDGGRCPRGNYHIAPPADGIDCLACDAGDLRVERNRLRAALAKAEADVAALSVREARAVGLLAKAEALADRIRAALGNGEMHEDAYAMSQDLLTLLREVGPHSKKCDPCSGSGKAHSIYDPCQCEPKCVGLGECANCNGTGEVGL